MCTYLHGPRGSIYYFRRAIPKDVRPYLKGAREWMVSLGTKERAEAKELVPLHTIRTGKLLKEIRARMRAGEAPPAAVPSKRVFSPEEVEARAQAQWEHQLEAMAHFQEMDCKEEAERESNPDAFLVADAVAAAKLQWDEELREARRETARRKAEAAVPVTQLFDGYASQPGLLPGTVSQFRAMIANLVRFLGHDDASRVTSSDIVKWRDSLKEETQKGGKPRSAKTINSSYLAAASVTFRWAWIAF